MTTIGSRIRKHKEIQMKNQNWWEDNRRKGHSYCMVVGCDNEVNYYETYYCEKHKPQKQ